MLTPSQFPGFPHRNGALYPQQILGPFHTGVLSPPLCEQDASPGDPPGSGVLALQQALGAPQRVCHPTLGYGDPSRSDTPLWYRPPKWSVSSLDISLWDKGGGIPTQLLDVSPQQRSCKLWHPVPPAQDPWTPPWAALTLASGDNGADKHPLPRAFPTGALGQARASPSPCPLRGGLGGLGHCLPWAGPPTAHGLSASWTLDLGTDNGPFSSSKHPGDAPMGVHSPALCLRARQHFVILIHYFS